MGLWHIGLSGGAPARLLGFGGNLTRVHPAVSPQGGHLVYEERVPFQGDIWQIPNPRVSPSDPVPSLLISSTRNDGLPYPSPEGRFIAFMSNCTGYSEIYVCNKDGSQLKQLTHLNGGDGSTRLVA